MPRQVKIIVVDDDPAYRDVLTQLAQQIGLTVISLKDGTEIMQWILNNTADMIMLDVEMPGFDGISVCRHIRSTRPDLRHMPIAIVSAHASNETKQAAIDAGADLYVEKPIKPKKLLEQMDELIDIKVVSDVLDDQSIIDKLPTLVRKT